MKRLPLLLASALLLAPAFANDQVRDVQGALKSQGFYYGEVTGAESAETGAAIRRFQIRNGIAVSGKLNAETLSALGLGEKKTAALAPQPGPAPVQAPAPAQAPAVPEQKQFNPPPPVQAIAPKPGDPVLPMKRVADLPRETGPQDPAPPAARRATLNDPSVIEPPAPLPAPTSTPYSTIFRDTTYATATREVQMDVVRRAQAIMAARRFYRGPVNGIANPVTSEAIFIFQHEFELPRTGRLDPDTLAEMHLLPPPAHGTTLLKPFYNPNRRRDRSVLSE